MATIARILHPTEFSDHSAAAAAYASTLAATFEADLHVLYVLEQSMDKIPEPDLTFPPPGESTRVGPAVLAALQKAVGLRASEASRLILATRLGPVSDQIVSYAKDADIDIIVIGTHGRRGLAHALTGSVAEAVVRKANCPVLTVPRK